MTRLTVYDSENEEVTVTIDTDDKVELQFVSHQFKVIVTVDNKILEEDIPY